MRRYFPLGFAIVLLLFLLCAIAWGQTATTSVVLGWVAPTTNTDGTKITGTLAYNLYQGPSAGPFVKVASGITGTTTTVTSVAAGNCFAITSVETIGVSSAEGSLSTTACVAQPGAPGSVTITVTVTVH